MFALGFLIAIAYWPGAIDPASVLRWAVMAIMAPAMLLFHVKRLPNPLQGLGLVTLITVCATAAWSSDVLNGIDQATHLAILAMVFCLGASARNVKAAWAGLAVGMLPAAAIARAQLNGWEGLFQAAVPGGLSVNKNMMSEAGAVAAIAAAAHGLWWAVPGALACAMLGSSKAAAGALVLACGLWLRPRRPAAAWAIFASLTLALVAAVFLEAPTLYQRFDMWNDALNHAPLGGHGLGSFAHDYPLYEHAHSEFVQAIYELGIFALMPAAVLVYVLKGGIDEPETLVLAALLGIALFSFPFHMPVTAFAAALAAGHLAGGRALVRYPEHAGGIPSHARPGSVARRAV